MKIIALNYLVTNAISSLKRFPLVLISSIIAVCFSIYFIENSGNIDNNLFYINAILSASLGIPLFFSIGIIASKFNLNLKWNIALNCLGVLILALLYYSFPLDSTYQNISQPYIRYAIFNICIHLFVSFVPYFNNKQHNGFWNYNKVLFLRFLLSFLYSIFLYLGIVLAIVSLNLLFNIDIHEKLYFELFIGIFGIFNTWFFISGIPTDLEKLEDLKEYPKGLKIFSQFVLLPLLILYLIILYAYASKIIFQWNWPKGLVSYLIIIVAVLGILNLLLIFPYGKLEGNNWIRKFSRAYYFILSPLVIMLFLAILMRTGDYGLTINRYLIITLGVWLSMVCIYFMIGKSNIKFIPISLCIITIAISFGPWSVFKVSERSQVNRLRNLLIENKIIVNDKIVNEPQWKFDKKYILSGNNLDLNENKTSDSLHNEIKSIIDYLDDHHGFQSIENWYSQPIDSIVSIALNKKNELNNFSEPEIYMNSLGLKYEFKYKNNNNDYTNINFVSANSHVDYIEGYERMISFNIATRYEKSNLLFLIDEKEYELKFEMDHNSPILFIQQNKIDRIEVKPLFNSLLKSYDRSNSSWDVAKDSMQVSGNINEFKYLIQFDNIGFYGKKGKEQLIDLNGKMFLKRIQK